MDHRFQLIPVRGRKPLCTSAITNCHKFQLIPARGRKRRLLHFALLVIHHFNLSPQGDENSILSTVVSPIHIFQLIPARGRKPHSDGRILGELPQFQLIPARGRKLHPIDSCIADPHISTYPRKGTETKRSIFILLITLFQLIPARGQKTPHQKDAEFFFCKP